MSTNPGLRSRISLLIEKLSISQTRFAREAGVPQSLINDIINGKATVSLKTINAICNRYKVNPTWLAWGMGDMFLTEEARQQISRAVASTLDGIQQLGKEMDQMTVEQYLEWSVSPENFDRRYPGLAPPGLQHLLSNKDVMARASPTSGELHLVADMIKAHPQLYRHASPEMFLELIASFRRQRADDITHLLTEIRKNTSPL